MEKLHVLGVRDYSWNLIRGSQNPDWLTYISKNIKPDKISASDLESTTLEAIGINPKCVINDEAEYRNNTKEIFPSTQYWLNGMLMQLAYASAERITIFVDNVADGTEQYPGVPGEHFKIAERINLPTGRILEFERKPYL